MDWMGFKIYAAPTVEPVTLPEMRTYVGLGQDETGNDLQLSAAISAARIHLEKVTGRIFCTSTYDVQFKSFADFALKLPVTPVQSVTSVVYKSSNVPATLAINLYELSDYGVFPVVKQPWNVTWPDADEASVIVRIIAGLASGPYDKLGVAIVKAIAADLFLHSESQSEINLTLNECIERMINSYGTR